MCIMQRMRNVCEAHQTRSAFVLNLTSASTSKAHKNHPQSHNEHYSPTTSQYRTRQKHRGRGVPLLSNPKHNQTLQSTRMKPGMGVEPIYSCSAGNRLNRSATPAS